MELVNEGNLEKLKEKLQEIADEALEHSELPRAKAEVRDERGNTLLLLAVWKGHYDIVEFLLTRYKDFDADFDKVERKVFFANVNAKDSKGWNACAIATFHERKKILELLLDHEGNPEARNSYGKSSFDLAQDDKDAARNVVKDRSEIRGVLLQWEQNQNPKAYAERIKKQEEEKEEGRRGGGKSRRNGKEKRFKEGQKINWKERERRRRRKEEGCGCREEKEEESINK